ncbi:hypothetical protein [Mucilaginibacter jinjuensis]|uniref:DUF4136 domain-containing protein n=1 Tax=Mucilaginibacter jinjuensis TaxID=1176721 RepID=A0ABY7TH66_9SPHI|nr:hypothetical protein [Mucilaginibacter jinjuensis]WCT14937.1 hypothetical protein PQO05_13420 [Mucilaginibacter jinjuensis]
MKKFRKANWILLAIVFATSCGTTTSITGSYKAPDVTQVSYKKIFISVLTESATIKNSVEGHISDYLGSKGYQSVKSSDVFLPSFHSSGEDKDNNVVLSKIRGTNSDAILTIALVKKETETRYVPGSGAYYPYRVGYYGSFGAYYRYGYGTFYTPGYYSNDKVYYLETNLYDAASEKLIWSAQSETYNPSSLDSFLAGYEKAIIKQIEKDHLIAPASK